MQLGWCAGYKGLLQRARLARYSNRHDSLFDGSWQSRFNPELIAKYQGKAAHLWLLVRVVGQSSNQEVKKFHTLKSDGKNSRWLMCSQIYSTIANGSGFVGTTASKKIKVEDSGVSMPYHQALVVNYSVEDILPAMFPLNFSIFASMQWWRYPTSFAIGCTAAWMFPDVHAEQENDEFGMQPASTDCDCREWVHTIVQKPGIVRLKDQNFLNNDFTWFLRRSQTTKRSKGIFEPLSEANRSPGCQDGPTRKFSLRYNIIKARKLVLSVHRPPNTWHQLLLTQLPTASPCKTFKSPWVRYQHQTLRAFDSD